MNRDYLELAQKRATTAFPPYQQPEYYGYDFRNWVSPYTKSANTTGGVAVVLQDWASAEKLREGPISEVQNQGHFPQLQTNKQLDSLVNQALGKSINEVYVTNVFPYVKPGSMSAPIPIRDLRITARQFTVPELELAAPKVVLAFGRLA